LLRRVVVAVVFHELLLTLYQLLLLLLLLLLILPISQRRTRLALRLESHATLARLVIVSFAAEFLSVTAIASFPNHRLGHVYSRIDLTREETGEVQLLGVVKDMGSPRICL
jgi:hypothetical protein